VVAVSDHSFSRLLSMCRCILFLIRVGEGIKIGTSFGTRRDKVLKAFVKCPSV
jgi:hypothetical protein